MPVCSNSKEQVIHKCLSSVFADMAAGFTAVSYYQSGGCGWRAGFAFFHFLALVVEFFRSASIFLHVLDPNICSFGCCNIFHIVSLLCDYKLAWG